MGSFHRGDCAIVDDSAPRVHDVGSSVSVPYSVRVETAPVPYVSTYLPQKDYRVRSGLYIPSRMGTRTVRYAYYYAVFEFLRQPASSDRQERARGHQKSWARRRVQEQNAIQRQEQSSANNKGISRILLSFDKNCWNRDNSLVFVAQSRKHRRQKVRCPRITDGVRDSL